MQPNDGNGAQLLQEYVQRALANKIKGGDASEYHNFVKEFTALRKKVERDPSHTGLMMLANLIHALRDSVSLLRERKHDAILTEVLGIKLWGAPPMVRSAVLDLVGNMVVANPAFAHTCLQLLVFNLLPPPGPATPEASNGPWRPSEEDVMVQSSVLGALIKILGLVPTAPGGLLSLVVQHMPHKLRDRNTQCLFLSAMFAVAEAPAGRPIRDALLAAAVEHMLTIDVDIRWEDIVDVPTGEEEEEGESEEEHEDIFELEGMSELDINADPEAYERHRQEQLAARGGWEGAAASVGHAAASGQDGGASGSGRPPVDETANKLDSMMELMFAHLARRAEQPGGAVQLWDTLLGIFERTILNTHRSKFSQYILFFVCGKFPDVCGRTFIDFLLARLRDERQPAITRSACAAYLASFLARAAFVPHGLVFSALSQLADYCTQYCAATPAMSRAQSLGNGNIVLGNSTTSSAAAPSAANCMTTKHQVLYASVQAILYVLCYHMEPLINNPQTTASHKAPKPEAVRALVVQHVVPLLSHHLQPLNVCLPSVVTEFKHQLKTLAITDITPLTPKDGDAQRAQRPLEMFFPFDPYLLKRSSRYLSLKSAYVRWKHGHPRSIATGGRVTGGSDSDDEEEGAHGQGAGDDMDDEDLELDDDDASSTSSSEDGTENESLRGASVPSDAVLSRPKVLLLPKRGSGLAVPQAVHHTGTAHAAGAAGRGGRTVGSKHGRPAEWDPMGTSISPGRVFPMGDATAGSSPVLVDYSFEGGQSYGGVSAYGASVSPMGMSWQPSHMEQHMSRLAPAPH